MENKPSFNLAIYRLLQNYPLYDYRIRTGGTYRLPILLIGQGKNLDTLRNKILSNGQLLKTSLEVTVVTENKNASLQALHENARDLKRFIQIQGDDTALEMDGGSLRFEQQTDIEQCLPQILTQYASTRYVLISLDTMTDMPDTLSPAPGQLIGWVKGDTIQVCGRKDAFPPILDDHAMAELLDIAYRLHYAYEKGNDPYITNHEIRESFKDPYNYQSNIECALHIRSKIKSADIDPSSTNSAAEAFAAKIAEDAKNNGDLLDRLAQLEHLRWCISKTAAGRRCDSGTVELIYGDDGSTTHSAEITDLSKKWHVALVPYRIDGKLRRHLSEQDWVAEDPGSITDLDELDKQTLRVHWRCAEISEKKLRLSLGHIEKLKTEVPNQLHVHISQMQYAVEQMLKGKRDAVFAYRYHLRNLEAGLTADKSTAGEQTLKCLKWDMGAPIEFLTRKDYKKQNLVLVGSTSFALCAWKFNVLVKLMAESVHECVSAAWQLEPGRIVFVDTAETLEELKRLSLKAHQIDRFLSRHCNQVQASYHIFVPQNVECRMNKGDVFLLSEVKTLYPTFFDSSDWHVIPCASLETEKLRPHFVDLMLDHGITSIDITGGKPELISLADGYARNNRAGAFFIRDNRIRSFCGARGMEQQALDKGMGVQQLFDQTDAELIKRDDDHISKEFFDQYQPLWSIALDHAERWYHFCICFAKAYRNKTGSSHDHESLRVPVKDFHVLVDKEYLAYKPEFGTILRKLTDSGILTCDHVQMFYQASCEEVLASLRNSGKVLEYYIYCTAKKSGIFKEVAMSWMFRHNDQVGAAKNELDVVCTGSNNHPLFISAKNVTPDSLKKNNFLNYICYEVGWLADRFGGANPRTILAAPNVTQFENGRRSDMVDKAMKRGVYLLGDRCFKPGNLEQVLRNIDQGKEDWCEFLLTEAELACV